MNDNKIWEISDAIRGKLVLINLCQCNFLHLDEILFQNEYMLKHMCFKNDFDLQS